MSFTVCLHFAKITSVSRLITCFMTYICMYVCAIVGWLEMLCICSYFAFTLTAKSQWHSCTFK